jgi:hypothetical protein
MLSRSLRSRRSQRFHKVTDNLLCYGLVHFATASWYAEMNDEDYLGSILSGLKVDLPVKEITLESR